jgi:hypothetical protein
VRLGQRGIGMGASCLEDWGVNLTQDRSSP